MTDNDAPSEDTTSLLIAAALTWLLLVILVLWFVWTVGDGWKYPLRHALSARLMLFGSILTVFMTFLHMLAGTLDGWSWIASSAAVILSSRFTSFAIVGYLLERRFGSPTVLSTGSFAPPNNAWYITVLRWWVYITCLSPLAFIPSLPCWSDFHILPIGLVVLGKVVSFFVIVFVLAALHELISSRPLRWTLVSNQQHDRNVAIKVECVAQRHFYDNIIHVFRGSIPQEMKPAAGSEKGNLSVYHITNPNSERIILVTHPKRWIELTPEDPGAFLDAITQALINRDPEYSMVSSDDGDEELSRLDGGKQPMIKSDGHQCDDGTLDSTSNNF